jgi:ATP-binding cassette subfamily F protein 3
MAKEEKKAKDKRANGHTQSDEARAELKTLKKRIKELDGDVSRFEREIEKIDAKLADTTLHANNPSEAASLAKTRAGAALALAKVEEEWLAVSARADSYA